MTADELTELVFFHFENVLAERDPMRLRFKVYSGGLRGGRILCSIRTRNDVVYYTLFADRGRTWKQPEPLRYTNGVEIMPNSNAACPVIRLRDGRIVIMYYKQASGTAKPLRVV